MEGLEFLHVVDEDQVVAAAFFSEESGARSSSRQASLMSTAGS